MNEHAEAYTDKQKLAAFWIEEIESVIDAEDFQRDFFESLQEQFIERESLSEKQMACLRKMYLRVT